MSCAECDYPHHWSSWLGHVHVVPSRWRWVPLAIHWSAGPLVIFWSYSTRWWTGSTIGWRWNRGDCNAPWNPKGEGTWWELNVYLFFWWLRLFYNPEQDCWQCEHPGPREAVAVT